MRRSDAVYVLLMLIAAVAIMGGCPNDEPEAEPLVPVLAPEDPAMEPPAEAAAVASEAAVTVVAETPATAPAPAAQAATPAPAAELKPAAQAASAPAAAPAPKPAPAPASAAAKGTVVVGKITVVSHVPQPSEVPYTDCLTMIKYDVESVESGSYGEDELLAAFWGMKTAKLQPAAQFKVGQRHRLTIEPLTKHPDLARAMQADDTNEYSLAPQWVVEYTSL